MFKFRRDVKAQLSFFYVFVVFYIQNYSFVIFKAKPYSNCVLLTALEFYLNLKFEVVI